MTREEAREKVSELSCSYHNIRMTDCPHCAKEVECLVKILTGEGEPQSELEAP